MLECVHARMCRQHLLALWVHPGGLLLRMRNGENDAQKFKGHSKATIEKVRSRFDVDYLSSSWLILLRWM